MITGYSIATLVVFLLSITFVIYPVSFHIHLPYLGRRRFSLNLTTAPILAIAILWAAQCIGATAIRNGFVGTGGIKPYNILILFSSLAYMAVTLDITGVLQAAAFWVSNKGGSNGWKLYLYFYMMLTTLSVLLGNDPVILSGTAFLVYYTAAAELEPIPWLISEFAAANTASMVLFVGNPTNVVICEGFGINNAAFTAYTILPFIACNITCFVALAFQFRDPKHIPRKLKVSGKLNVRGVLLDPVSAWVGSILLGTCLIVIIVVSFFKVDVWMISLPFAVVKFLFDLSWDHYRFVQGKPMLGRGQLTRVQSPKGEIPAVQAPMMHEIKRAMSFPPVDSQTTMPGAESSHPTVDTITTNTAISVSPPPAILHSSRLSTVYTSLSEHFPTFFTALPRLPLGLIPFAFSQFILIEGLEHQGWINIFANWLVRASDRHIYSTIWLIGVLGVLMCNIAGTNIGATILLTKVVRAAPEFPEHSTRAAAIALAVASNIGAVSFTFSASLAGLLWNAILKQKGVTVKQGTFAFWNLLPLAVMTTLGLAVVSAEMAVLYKK